MIGLSYRMLYRKGPVHGMNLKDKDKNQYMLNHLLGWKGYDWWWHSFTGENAKTGEERTFFIEYFIINPRRGGSRPIYGKNGANKPSYMMVKAGCWGSSGKQLHRFFGIDEIECNKDEMRVVAGDCFLSENVIKGNINVGEDEAKEHPERLSDAGKMSWLLQVDKKVAFNVGYGTSKPLRELTAFDMYWHAEGMKTEYDGTVYLDGEKYIVSPESCYGYADKNWGRSFTNPWIWLSSNDLKSNISGEVLKNSVFDIGGGCPKIFGIPIKETLLSDMYYEGKEYEFNFSKFWTFTQTKFKCVEKENEIIWHIRTANTSGAMEIRAVCPKKDMIKIRYEAPDGTQPHTCLWNGGTGTAEIKLYRRSFGILRLVDEIVAGHVGCEYGRADEK